MNLEKIIAVRNAKTIYKDGDKCVKVFNENYSKADILNEALNQARVEELDINVPKIEEISMVDGKWAIVTEFIKGNTLAQLMEKFLLSLPLLLFVFTLKSLPRITIGI